MESKYRPPMFLLGGVDKVHNFLGLRTCQTAVYSWVELYIKVAPIFVLLYCASN